MKAKVSNRILQRIAENARGNQMCKLSFNAHITHNIAMKVNVNLDSRVSMPTKIIF